MKNLDSWQIAAIGIVVAISSLVFIISIMTGHMLGILFGLGFAVGYPIFIWWVNTPEGRAY